MKQLFVIRHAKSSWDNPRLPDFDRPLNNRGLRDAPAMARIVEKNHKPPEILITSTANRALQTAQFFSLAWSLREDECSEEPQLYHASVSTILSVVRRIDESVKTAAIVGHNPGLTDFVSELAGGEAPYDLPTCAICLLTSEAEYWSAFDCSAVHLTAYFYPKKDMDHYQF